MDSEVTRIFGAETPSGKPQEDGAPNGVFQTETMGAMAAWATAQFRRNFDARQRSGVDARLARAMEANCCRYTREQRDKLERAGIDSRIYSPITSVKVRAAKSMLVDLVNSAEDPLFQIQPTASPEVPESVTEQVGEEMAAEIENVISMFASAGSQGIPPNAMSVLESLVAKMSAGRVDEVRNREMSEARARAKRLETKVFDAMQEGGFRDAFNDYVNNICVYGTGIILGPLPKTVCGNVCRDEKDKSGKPTGVRKYFRKHKRILAFESVSPVDCYPPPDASSIDDGPLCIRVRYTADELWRFTVEAKDGVGTTETNGEGWNAATVRDLLALHPSGGVTMAEFRRDPNIRAAENKPPEDVFDCGFDGFRIFASVRGSMLHSVGVTVDRRDRKVEQQKYYRVDAIVVGGYVVYCRILDDEVGFPVVKGVYYEVPGSWWGESIADKLVLVQSTMNNCIRWLLTNMAVASGPMYWVRDLQTLADRTPNGLRFAPHKVFAFNRSMMGGDSGAPMGIIDVPSNINELLALWEKMKAQADDDSGVPAYTYGQSGGQGALRTASGLAMFTEAANRGMKMVITSTDYLVIMPLARKTADWFLANDPDQSIKCDVEVAPTGLMGKIMSAQQAEQRRGVLQMVITNPSLTQIVGVRGIVELFRPSVRDLNINPDNVVPSDDRIREQELLAQIQQIMTATQGAQDAVQGVAQEAAPQQAPQQPPQPGSVAERRGVA